MTCCLCAARFPHGSKAPSYEPPRPGSRDNCNVSINKLADDVIAFTEIPVPVRFDPETLETLGVNRYKNVIGGQISIVHPHFDFHFTGKAKGRDRRLSHNLRTCMCELAFSVEGG